MTTSGAAASKEMVRLAANACTDITGFALLGHAFELAKASDVTLEIESNNVPLLPDVIALISQGMLTRGDKNNRIYVGNTVAMSDNVSSEMQSALYDPQTAGGLLAAVPPARAEAGLAALRALGETAAIIGTVTASTDTVRPLRLVPPSSQR